MGSTIDQSIRQTARGVWITRAEPGASATAERAAALGFAPIIAPLLTFRPLSADLGLVDGEALAFTSINGVVRAAALTERREVWVFAVGDATAEAARAAGFFKVVSAAGDVETLAAQIINARPRCGVVHPSALETAGDLVGALRAAGVSARRVAVYEAMTATVLPGAVATALSKNELVAALFHSPKAARVAMGIAGGWRRNFAQIVGVGLSEVCIAPLHGAGFRTLMAASAPTEDALMKALAALGREAR